MLCNGELLSRLRRRELRYRDNYLLLLKLCMRQLENRLMDQLAGFSERKSLDFMRLIALPNLPALALCLSSRGFPA